MKVADETGGGAWFAEQMSDLRGRFAEIVADLSGRYVLSYVPRRPLGGGEWRELTVQIVNHRDYSVKARTGYIAAGRSASQAPQPQ